MRKRTKTIALAYPAEPSGVNWANLNPASDGMRDYRYSVANGRGGLADQLNNGPKDPCLILAGYSQGAHVVGDVLAGTGLKATVRRRIVAAVLLADPRFDPKDTDVTKFGGLSRDRGGFFTARPRGRMTRGGVEVLSVCRRGDLFCQFINDWPTQAVKIHADYSDWAKKMGKRVAYLAEDRSALTPP